MTIEHAVVQAKHKPWGCSQLLPWSHTPAKNDPIGELWFARPDATAPESALLVKLLFPTEPLSIQVHPDDVTARSIGQANGKTEAWYILSAAPDVRVAVGLKHPLSAEELRSAITDASIADLVQWHSVRKGDAIFVPAGTIHAIGAGIVLAEIQQRSDTTFRLFDHGRQRELHIDDAVAAARAAPAERQSPPVKLNETRSALVISPYFVLEHVDLLQGSIWTLDSRGQTWILVIGGCARFGSTNVSLGQAVFLEADRAEIVAGADGMKALLAYPGPKVNSGALCEKHPTMPEHPRLITQEVPTWPL